MPYKPVEKKQAGKETPTREVETVRHGFKSREKMLSDIFRDDLKPDDFDFMDIKKDFKARSIYDERLGLPLVEHMGNGKSYNSFAGVLGVSATTLHAWEEKHPDWLEWKERAVAVALNFWEGILIDGITKEVKTEAKLMIFKLKNMFPDEYKEKIEVENVTPTTIVIEGLEGDFTGSDIEDADYTILSKEEKIPTIEFNDIDDV